MTFKPCVPYVGIYTTPKKTFHLIYAYTYKIYTYLFVYYSLFCTWKNLTDIYKK